jgi:hypothetical protein
MFISNQEKSDINKKIEQNKNQMESLVKHMAKLQVDVGSSDLTKIPALTDANKQLNRSFWANNDRIKTLNTTLVSLQNTCEHLIKTNASLSRRLEVLEGKKKPMGRPPKRMTISADKVQAMKDAGIWDDPIKRIRIIDELIKQEQQKKIDEKRAKQREYNRAYKARLKAEKAIQKELL